MSNSGFPRVDLTFDGERFTSIQTTLDEIAKRLRASISLEDLQGRLLFTGGVQQVDAWRDDFTPFASPRHPRHREFIDQWLLENDHEHISHVPLNPREDRVVFPLTYHGEGFVLVNITAQHHFGLASAFDQDQMLDRFGDKIYMVMMGSINAVRQRFLSVDSDFETTPLANEALIGYRAVSLLFPRTSVEGLRHSLVDYGSIAVWHTRKIGERVLARYTDAAAFQSYFIRHEGGSLETLMLLGYEQRPQEAGDSDLRAAWESALEAQPGIVAGIGSLFTRIHELPQRAQDAADTRSLGISQAPAQRVFQSYDVGIDAFLTPVLDSLSMQRYAQSIIRSLPDRDGVLVQTLLTYFEEDGSTVRTAEALHVDRRTITYRLDRISRALGLDLTRLRNRFLLYVVLKTITSR